MRTSKVVAVNVACWDSEWRGAVQAWVAETGTVSEEGTEAVGHGFEPWPRRCQGWVRRQRMARTESRRARALDSGAKGANHLKGNFVDLEAFHGTSLVAAASRPLRTDDGSPAGRKEETTRSTRNLRGRRRMPDTADARARRQTQGAAAYPLAYRTPLTPSAKPRPPQALPKRPRADGIRLTKQPRKTDVRGAKSNSAKSRYFEPPSNRKEHSSPPR